MIPTLIIYSIVIFAAFYSGFYFGYYKREGKAPELPIMTDVKKVIEKATETKPQKPSNEEMKANSFFN